jgi:site-specific DNA-methyltransferase (adenine-specific)
MMTTCDTYEHTAKTSATTTLSGAAGEADTARVDSQCRLVSRRSTSRRVSPLSDARLFDLSCAPTPIEAHYEIHHADAFARLAARAENSIHVIVSEPPYGLKEFMPAEQAKTRTGMCGVWSTLPSFDGAMRMGLPRFTGLNDSDIAALRRFFETFARLAVLVLVPGGHVMIATNPLLSQYVYGPMREAGFEKRGEIIRLVQTLRGGDRRKNAHEEFPGVSVMPRSAWEPWGLFRKPIEGRVQDNLRKWGTGGLRRVSADKHFTDIIQSSPTRGEERRVAPRPALKPQAFMRQLVAAALPLAGGVILDPFMGAGSTSTTAQAVEYESIAIEQDAVYFHVAEKVIPELARLNVSGATSAESSYRKRAPTPEKPKANTRSIGSVTRLESGAGMARHVH